MNTENLPDLGFDWDTVIEMIKTSGVDFGINLATAVIIFFVGKWVANLLTKALRKLMQKQEVDKTLETKKIKAAATSSVEAIGITE